MKGSSRMAGLVVALLTGALNIHLAQADQVFLMRKSVTSATNFDEGTFKDLTDVQIAENHAYLSWISYGDTNHPGGLERMLIIPGGTFLFDPVQGLERFIDSVSDIRISLQSYSYAGD